MIIQKLQRILFFRMLDNHIFLTKNMQDIKINCTKQVSFEGPLF